LNIEPKDTESINKTTELLKVAALYHDIGKCIRRANHPRIGANIIRNYDEAESENLVNHLVYTDESDDTPKKYNRFTLISSIIEHHDKFGVVSTGEGGLPIFSDILYFTSNKGAIEGIKKNVTSVMLVNLADIAAVNTSGKEKHSVELVRKISTFNTDEKTENNIKSKKILMKELEDIFKNKDSCLGLSTQKVTNVLQDWKILLQAITDVEGDRTHLKTRLLEIEQNPSRTIYRILRLLKESAITSNVDSLLKHMTPTIVESVLVSTLGPYRFQTFCEELATIVKFDYGLNFFKAILCATIRNKIHPNYVITFNDKNNWDWKKISNDEESILNKMDNKQQSELTRIITTLFVKVIESLVGRYENILQSYTSNARRFGFQMRDLTLDKKIRDSIIDLLCIQNSKDSVALTWIADEVTIWSMD
jgi:putative nucleotidyltransferase with HDIG domain